MSISRIGIDLLECQSEVEDVSITQLALSLLDGGRRGSNNASKACDDGGGELHGGDDKVKLKWVYKKIRLDRDCKNGGM